MYIRPSTHSRPILDTSSLAAELKGDSAEGSNLRLHHVPEAEALSIYEEIDPRGGPLRRMKEFVDTARAPGEIRE